MESNSTPSRRGRSRTSPAIPGLTRSPPAVYSSYEKILIDGALAERGMPRFDYLDKVAVAALRAYVLEGRRQLAAAR